MKTLIISDGSVVIVDDEDFERLSQFRWILSGKYNSIICRHDNRIINMFSMKRQVFVIPIANEIMRRFDCLFDHKDRNSRNNTKENLRECSKEQNSQNRRKCLGTTSKYKGVSYRESRKKWRASIQANGIRKELGEFKSEEEAAFVYNEAAKKLHGEFAVLNNIILQEEKIITN